MVTNYGDTGRAGLYTLTLRWLMRRRVGLALQTEAVQYRSDARGGW